MAKLGVSFPVTVLPAVTQLKFGRIAVACEGFTTLTNDIWLRCGPLESHVISGFICTCTSAQTLRYSLKISRVKNENFTLTHFGLSKTPLNLIYSF